MKTIADAKAWAEENAEELDAARLACDDETIQMFNRVSPELSKRIWNTGGWLGHELRRLGATDNEVDEIQFAMGQRAFGGDAWQAAVDYVNEFSKTGTTEETGGLELADKINNELFGSE